MGVPTDIFIGPVQIHLYSIFFGLGIFTAFVIARRAAHDLQINIIKFDQTVLFAIILGIFGARAFFVLGASENYYFDKLSILKFWEGGLAFYGGVIGGLLGLLLGKYLFKISFLKILDSVSLGVPFGQAIGRLGNFFNQEAYGRPIESGFGIYIAREKRLLGYESFDFFQPAFLYESLGLIIIFVSLRLLWPRLKDNLLLTFSLFAILTGTLRYFIEEIRLDALKFGSLMISQLVAIVLISLGVLILSLYARKIS